jgi:NAD-dependent SIR2 family protein deacetylase
MNIPNTPTLETWGCDHCGNQWSQEPGEFVPECPCCYNGTLTVFRID